MLTVAYYTRALTAALLLTLLLSTAPLTAAQTKKLSVGKSKFTRLAPASVQPYAWAPAPPMPTARTGVAAAVLNGKLYVMGGFDNNSVALKTLEVFDPATNTWSAAPDMPTARGFLAAAVLNNNIYAIGGFGATSSLNTVEVFDPIANSWSGAPSMPTARDSLAAAVVNTKLYALGGENTSGTPLQTVEVFDPVGNSWSGAPSLPTARLGLAATVFNNQIYAIGGFSSGNALQTVEAFDPVGNSWSGAPSLPTARQGLAAVVLNNNIFAIGGVTTNNTFLNTVEEFDGNSWSAAPSLPTARDYLGAGVLNNKIYAAGGFDGSNNINTVEVFTPIAQAGDVLISEFRLDGPGGAQDEFIELYNNTDQPITVAASDASTGWGLFTSDGTLRAALLNGDFIPARGHFLLTNANGYSLAGYPTDTAGVGGATGDRTYNTDIPVNTGIALATTTTAANFSTGNTLDAVGSTTESNTGYKEGAGYPAISANSGFEYSFLRKLNTGLPQDTNDNAADFSYVAADNTTDIGAGSRLGAPGPENTHSPVQRNATVKAALIDSGCTTTTVGPNNSTALATCPRVRDVTPTTNGPNGTLSIRRTFINNTGRTITRLRFRVVDMTTAPAPAGTADLRALSSSDINNAVCVGTGAGCSSPGALVTIHGTTLETPPNQPMGGGLNASLSADVITTNVSLAPGAKITVQFLLGVVQGGSYRFMVNVEALP